jgi:hypothetical protein
VDGGVGWRGVETYLWFEKLYIIHIRPHACIIYICFRRSRRMRGSRGYRIDYEARTQGEKERPEKKDAGERDGEAGGRRV